jgi:L-aminopeptidase/D-esterase-like protein
MCSSIAALSMSGRSASDARAGVDDEPLHDKVINAHNAIAESLAITVFLLAFYNNAIKGVAMRVRLLAACLCLAVPAPSAAQENATLTAVPGIRVGHYTYAERPTGCTAILVDGDAVGGVSQKGGAPGTRETDLLDPLNMVDKVNAVLLAGGSAFGLDAASGVMRWLEEHDVGWPAGPARVPIVPAAILFDLGVGGTTPRPNADCGYRAAAAATSNLVAEGSIGAGAGATVGKFGGGDPMKSGIGSASLALPNGLIVAAIVAVNAAGDIIDPNTGRIVAGMRNADGTLADARKVLQSGANLRTPDPGRNTSIGVVATNARLSKAEASRMALMADDGYARTIYPSHTIADGDTIFSLATGRWNGTADTTIVGALAAEAVARAVVRAATQATSVAGITAARDLK